jgi:hypothetical protein
MNQETARVVLDNAALGFGGEKMTSTNVSSVYGNRRVGNSGLYFSV